MTLRLPFTVSTEGPLHRALFVSGERRPIQANSPAILDPDWDENEQTPWTRFGVNNNNREEVAIYLGLAWSLLQGRRVFAIPTGYSLEAERHLGRRGGIVGWQYEVDPEGPPSTIKERGFRRAKTSAPIRPPPNPYEKLIRDKAELFELASFQDLVSATRAVLCDAYAEVNLFGIAGEPRRLHHLLSSKAEPTLQSLLQPGDLLMDLVIGVDTGYNDALLAYSRESVEAHLHNALRIREAAIVKYERRAQFLTDLPTLLQALAELAGVE